MRTLDLSRNGLTALPEWLGGLSQLRVLGLNVNRLTDLPSTLGQLGELQSLNLDDNPLNPELAAAYKEGLDAVKRFLRAKAAKQVISQ